MLYSPLYVVYPLNRFSNVKQQFVKPKKNGSQLNRVNLQHTKSAYIKCQDIQHTISAYTNC